MIEGISDKLYERLDLENSWCLKNPNFTIQGKFIGDFFKYLEIKLYKCDNSTSTVNCADTQEIDDVINDAQINVVFLNKKVEFENYSDPI